MTLLLVGSLVMGAWVAWSQGLVEWDGDRLVVGGTGPLAVLTLGGLGMAYFIGIGIGSGTVSTVGGGASAPSYSAPNTPTIDVIVDDTSTWRVTFSAFSGDGDDTQDSISVTVLRSGAADTLFHAVSGVQTADTISDNTDLKADTTYRVLGRQKGVGGGWSIADTVSVLNEVEVSGAPDSVFFFSDWRTGTGTGSTAYTDGGKWGVFFTADGFNIDGTPACSGFPTSNVFTTSVSPETGMLLVTGVRSTPSVGDSVALRYYGCVTAAAPDGETHGLWFDDSSGGTNWGPQALGMYDQTDANGWEPWVSVASGQDPRYFAPNNEELSHDTVYRIELLYIRSGTNSYQVRARIYSSGGTLLYDETDWPPANGWGHDGQAAMHTRTFSLTGAGAASMTGLAFGGNVGPPGEWTAFAICSSWCGAYPIAGVEN